jgi:hypothetical protein
MKPCDRNHPDNVISTDSRGVPIRWGGLTGEMLVHQRQPFFGNVTLHRNWNCGKVVAQVGNKFHTLFEGRHFCCAVHQKEAELIKVASQPWAEQTDPFCGGDKDSNGRWNMPIARAFVQARKIAKSKRSS